MIFKLRNIVIISFFFTFNTALAQKKEIKINRIQAFENVNHPEIAYWFFSKDQLKPENYQSKIDSLSQFSKYTLIFLTARNGVNFYDTQTLYPVFKDLVTYAQRKGLKIGLQLWDKKKNIPIENTERIIQEGEILLNETGSGSYVSLAKHIRDKNLLLKSELFKVYLFKKTSDGFYDLSTLKDITNECRSVQLREKVEITLNFGSKYKGYTAYILTQHYYDCASNYSSYPVDELVKVFKAYADIPFAGVGLDEYTNLRVVPNWELKNGDVLRERYYSLPMAKVFNKNTGLNLDQTLFDMRYAPEGRAEKRVTAINYYMATMRAATLGIEKAIYDKGKEYFGKNTFIGLHETHHNDLDFDEIWQTGLNWWNVKRDYGHSDENTPTPTQMGLAMSYPMNAMYNMYYNKKLETIYTKAIYDLRYGIRTHYHAINDVQNWGVSVEKIDALKKINQVENSARLLNRFNPSLPKIKLLVVFGMEAQANWYPDTNKRGTYDITKNLGIEAKAKEIWDNGYLNALVPTDVIADGRLKINADGKPTLQGHQFDAIIFLYPQYAKETTLQFLEDYISKGGKLMLKDSASFDFDGNDISARWKKISDNATVKNFSIADISKLGIEKNILPDGVLNEDGSFTFTSPKSLKNNQQTTFDLNVNGINYSANYMGISVIKTDNKGNLQRFTASGFTYLKLNGQEIFRTDKMVDVYLEVKKNNWIVSIADPSLSAKILINKL